MLHFVLHTLKVTDDFRILFCSFFIDRIPVNSFHDMVGSPATTLHNVLIRHTNGMQDTGRVVPEVMEAKLLQSG